VVSDFIFSLKLYASNLSYVSVESWLQKSFTCIAV
jgi:hypothetical protein